MLSRTFVVICTIAIAHGRNTVAPSPTAPKSPQPCPSDEGHEETNLTKRPFTIVVEGSKASGKSTLLHMIEQIGQDVLAIYEPVGSWKNVSGADLGKLAFKDPDRWTGAYLMATLYGFITVALQKPILPDGRQPQVVIRERSLHSGMAALDLVKKNRGQDSSPELHLAEQWYNLIMETYHEQLTPDLIVYLRTNTTTLLRHHHERISRGSEALRYYSDEEFKAEVKVTIKLHDDWLYYKNSSYPVPAPVLVIDGNTETTNESLKKLIAESIPQITLKNTV